MAKHLILYLDLFSLKKCCQEGRLKMYIRILDSGLLAAPGEDSGLLALLRSANLEVAHQGD